MISGNKAIVAIALIATALILTSTIAQTTLGQSLQSSKGKQQKCNNLKIMAVVTGLNLKSTDGLVTLTGSATLQGQTVSKTITVNASDPTDDDGVGIPLFFKKAFEPCPALGTQYTGMVNGITFASTLTSLTRPNLVQVDLSIAPQAGK